VLSGKVKPQIPPLRYPGSEVRSHGTPWQAGSQKRRVESCGVPLKPKNGLTPISCHAVLERSGCAPFIKERRMECINATRIHRKSGQWGTQPSLLKGKTADPSASFGMTKWRAAPHLESGGVGWTESVGTCLRSSSDPGGSGRAFRQKSLHQYREQARWVYTGWRFWNGGLKDPILNSVAKLRRRTTLPSTGAFSQLEGGDGYKTHCAQ